MENEKKSLLEWVNVHKKQLIIAGISIPFIVGIIIGFKNKDVVMELWSRLEKSIKKSPDIIITETRGGQVIASGPNTMVSHCSYTVPQESVDVSQHIRTMSGGRHHSAEKAVEAAMLGIVLLPNQTLVDSYTKYIA